MRKKRKIQNNNRSNLREISIISNSDLFNAVWYESTYGVKKDNAAEHYLREGWKKGYDPSIEFSTEKYLSINSDVQNINPLLHYEIYGKYEGRCYETDFVDKLTSIQYIENSIYFDAIWYGNKYRVSSGQAANHYLNIGWKQFYDPSEHFSTAAYLHRYNDIARAGINPLLHYEKYGKKEANRFVTHTAVAEKYLGDQCGTIKNSVYFDEAWYKDTYHLPDDVDAAKHYLIYGSDVSLDPSTYFSARGYVMKNPLRSCANPLLDFELSDNKYEKTVLSCDDNYDKTIQRYANEGIERLKVLARQEGLSKECVELASDAVSRTSDNLNGSKVHISMLSRQRMNEERGRILEEGKIKYRSKRILVMLPTTHASGGANVVLSEFQAMTRMGVEVTIANLNQHRVAFETTYGNLLNDFKRIYLNHFSEINEIISEYDAVVCTLYETVFAIDKYAENLPVIGYYVQDFEPYFFNPTDAEYDRALRSYNEIPGLVRFTKTKWNQNELYKQLKLDSVRVGISCNLNLFRARKDAMPGNTIVITAMLRPETTRRGPDMTYEVLRRIAKEYRDKVTIRFFGCDCRTNPNDYMFFRKHMVDFDFEMYGLLKSEETAQLLAESDIFVDFSVFQAMGLTAMEAMASGCATIVPCNGGTSDYAVNERNALIVNTESYDECYLATKRLVDDTELRRKLSCNAVVDICHHYPEKVAINILGALFNNLAKTPKREDPL